MPEHPTHKWNSKAIPREIAKARKYLDNVLESDAGYEYGVVLENLRGVYECLCEIEEVLGYPTPEGYV